MAEPTRDDAAEARQKKYGRLPERVDPDDMVEVQDSEPPNPPVFGDPTQAEFMRNAGIF